MQESEVHAPISWSVIREVQKQEGRRGKGRIRVVVVPFAHVHCLESHYATNGVLQPSPLLLEVHRVTAQQRHGYRGLAAVDTSATPHDSRI